MPPAPLPILPCESEFAPVTDKDDIDALLDELNEWEQKYGPLGGGKGLDSTGEAPARIAELKRQLVIRGVTVAWDGAKYVIVAPEDGDGR